MAYYARRTRIVYLGIIATLILFLFYRSSSKDVEARIAQDFYQKTVKAMDETRRAGQAVWNHGHYDPNEQQTRDRDGDGDVDEDDKRMARELTERLKEAELRAKEAANEKAGWRPDPPSKVVGMGSAREGQDKTGRKGRLATKPKTDDDDDGEEKVAETVPKKKANEKLEVEDEVYKARKEAVKKEKAAEKMLEMENDDNRLEAKKLFADDDQAQLGESEAEKAMRAVKIILKKAPMVIFSKTYCPYSKRAKKLLLEKYSIKPAPVIVELDEEEKGPQLQGALAELTGRRTVPNIVVNGYSLGGADEVTGLDEAEQLVSAILKHGDGKVDIVERTLSTVREDVV